MEIHEVEKGRFYRHADGGLYRVTGFRRGKVDDGPWVEGVEYETMNEELPTFWTNINRFCSRFKPEIPSDQHETLN